jgi:hypothetical protein
MRLDVQSHQKNHQHVVIVGACGALRNRAEKASLRSGSAPRQQRKKGASDKRPP